MKFYCFFFIAFIVSSCSAREKISVEKVWFYNDDLSQAEQVNNVLTYGSTSEYGFNGASFLNLRSDGKFTSYFSAFDYGEWKMQDSILVLTNHNKGKLLLDVKQLDAKKMVCVNKDNRKLYPFNGFPNEMTSDEENAFSISNNLWRVKANHKETDEELRLRLKNHFRWWEKYFAWALKNKMEVVDIRSTASVLEMYANGFELRYYDEQFPEWRNIFYDTANCWRAYEIVYYMMYKKNVNWPKTENRFEGFVSAFTQLQQWMDIDPKTYLPEESRRNKAIARGQDAKKD
jgi:hypothetical protein